GSTYNQGSRPTAVRAAPAPPPEETNHGARLLRQRPRWRAAGRPPAARPVPHQRLARAPLRRRAAPPPARLDLSCLGPRRAAPGVGLRRVPRPRPDPRRAPRPLWPP